MRAFTIAFNPVKGRVHEYGWNDTAMIKAMAFLADPTQTRLKNKGLAVGSANI